METVSHSWTKTDADAARMRFDARTVRLARGERIANRDRMARLSNEDQARIDRQTRVAAAFERARARRAAAKARSQ
jgi:hypothetical protein